jgi:uncharacterized protein
MLHLVPIVFLAMVYAWASSAFPWLAGRKRLVGVALALLWSLHPISQWLYKNDYPSEIPTAVVEFLTVPLLIAALPLAMIRLCSWGIERFASKKVPSSAAAAAADSSASGGPAMTRRQLVEATAGVAVLGATGSMLGWGMVRGRHAFEVREVAVRIAALPRVLDGYVIAQVSDIHAGMHVGDRELDEGLALVRKARPDLLVSTGDMVDFDPDFAPKVARKLTDLAVRDGVAAVLGNHDYYADADEVASALRAGGVDVLVDEGRVIRARDGGGFALLGVDDRWSTRYGRAGPQLDLATAMVPPGLARVLLSHQPSTVDRWSGHVALQLSGHTHGGQINPGFRPAALFFKYLHGRYDVGGTTLYVNRGFGTVGPPSRVGAPPEITRFVLVAG